MQRTNWSRVLGRSIPGAWVPKALIVAAIIVPTSIFAETGATGQTPKTGGIDRTHPLGLEYWQPYGILTTKYATPHVQWGKPLAGGPIKVLVMAPTWTHRETVELAQRLDVRFTAWMSYDSERLQMTIGETGFPSRQMVCELLSEYLEADYHVMVIGKLRWSMIPTDDRLRILEKVSQGTGLVYVGPPELDRELEIVFGKHPAEGGREILDGVPWQSLPRLRKADPAKLVRTGTFGKGKVVLLNYQEVRTPSYKDAGIDMDMHSLTPSWVQVSRWAKNWPVEEKPDLELGPYEYYQSLVCRAVRWAAGRASGVRLKAEIPDGISAGKEVPVKVRVENAAQTLAEIKVVVRTNEGKEVFEKSLRCSAAAPEVPVEVPSLWAGQYLLDLWAKDREGRVLEWSASAFEVKHGNRVAEVSLTKALLECGDQVEAKVGLAQPLAPGEELVAELWDLHGRKIASRKVPSEGTFATARLGPLAPVHRMHELRFRILRDDVELVRHSTLFPVRTKLHWDDFANVVWANEQGRNSWPTFQMLKKLREVDEVDVIDTLPGSMEPNPRIKETMQMRASQCARANLMICPYNGSFGHLTAPKDTHVATQPLADPAYLEGIAKNFRLDADIYGPYGPFVWTHGDESKYTLEDLDVDWSPTALERFRRLLKEKLYPNLDALNQEWGTAYSSWETVMPVAFATAKQTGNFAPWVTHKLSSNAIFAETYKKAGDFLREGDPGARTGFDGAAGLYCANSGYDWWLLAKNMTLIQSYHSEDIQSEVWRSFAPVSQDTVRGLWLGTYAGGDRPSTIEYMHYHPWYSLFHHMNTTWWWTMGAPGPLSGYAPDLTTLAYMQAYVDASREIKRGLGKLILSSGRADDRIAVHFSESSRIADSLYSAQSNAWYCDYVDAIGNVSRALEDAGFQYRFVAYEEIEQGALQKGGYRVFFLPHSRAISDKEAEAILRFVREGGVVIADILPGILTGTGAKRKESCLTTLFSEAAPGTVKPFGKGAAIFMGTDRFKGYYRAHISDKGWKGLEGRWKAMADLLQRHVPLKPAVAIESGQGDLPPPEVVRFDADGIELVTLLRPYGFRDNQAYRVQVRFGRKAHLYDARAGVYLGYADGCERIFDYQAQVLALSPYKVGSVEVRLEDRATRGTGINVSLAVKTASGDATGKHVLRLTMVGPDGRELEWYAQNVLVLKGKATITIPLALNEAAGTFSIWAREVMSGTTGKATFALPKEAQRQ